ncbi:hypothetical protein PR048_029111 [Dryococelus australis]|uniref:Uncharacterized protein n=1 Tax=Dryococelus australis TaxID=614101 RepID=A0ABQ9GCF4_9NEOP|nr:hypothetical protein PR048_029111 [Dryococelus australis]
MGADIGNFIGTCDVHIFLSCNNTKEPLLSYPLSVRPWERVGCDPFQFDSHHYLVCYDGFSNWIEVSSVDNSIISVLIFLKNGISNWCSLATGTSGLLRKSYKSSHNVNYALSEYRNTHIAQVGLSPAQMICRTLKSILQCVAELFTNSRGFQVRHNHEFIRHCPSRNLCELCDSDGAKPWSKWHCNHKTAISHAPLDRSVLGGEKLLTQEKPYLAEKPQPVPPLAKIPVDNARCEWTHSKELEQSVLLEGVFLSFAGQWQASFAPSAICVCGGDPSGRLTFYWIKLGSVIQFPGETGP